MIKQMLKMMLKLINYKEKRIQVKMMMMLELLYLWEKIQVKKMINQKINKSLILVK
jgi:hypothetical protein